MPQMEIIKMMTDKGEYDIKEDIATIQEKVAKWWLQTFSRWEVDSYYKEKQCKDTQSLILDLDKVEVYWYTTHNLNFDFENEESVSKDAE